MAWYTYLVRCEDGSLYCGITTDLERRINEHNETRTGVFKGSAYCRTRQPVRLVWFREYADRSGASKCEHRIKKLHRVKKEALVARNTTSSGHAPSSAGENYSKQRTQK